MSFKTFDVLPPSSLVLWLLIEWLRLRAGRLGNTVERVSSLAASLLLLCFPQIPAIIYLGFGQEIPFKAESILSILMIIILVFEAALTLIVIKGFIKCKTISFYEACDKELKKEFERKNEIAYWSRQIALEESGRRFIMSDSEQKNEINSP